MRASSVERAERAAAEVERAVSELEQSLSIARWSAAPDQKRWRVALGRATVGRRHGGIEIARLVETLKELPAVLEQQQTPDEIEPEPPIKFGWPAVGETMPIQQ